MGSGQVQIVVQQQAVQDGLVEVDLGVRAERQPLLFEDVGGGGLGGSPGDASGSVELF